MELKSGKELQTLLEHEQWSYRMTTAGPPLDREEVETAQRMVEVVVMWGELSVLSVAHLSPPRAFYLGDEVDARGRLATDFLVASEAIGTERLPVVVNANGGVAVVFPKGSAGEVTENGETRAVDELLAAGGLQPCTELAGAWQYPLASGASARVSHRGFVFLVSMGSAGKRIGIGGRPSIDWRRHSWTLVTAGLTSLLLLMFYLLPPKGVALSLERLDENSRLVRYMSAPPEFREVETPEFLRDEDKNPSGKRHNGEEGQMGTDKAPKNKKRFGIQGPPENPDPHMAREQAREQADSAGIIRALQRAAGSWNSPTSPYGRETALGRDPMSELGGLLGDNIGSSFGFGGLGMRGTGRGGGGPGEGTIGLRRIGTVGSGGYGNHVGYGRPKRMREHKMRGPIIRTSQADVHGGLSKEVIRRTIRRHLNEVRFCYEQELKQRPDLEGRVAVKFIIAPTGEVKSAARAASTANNARLETCIVKAVKRWTFPAPEGGGLVVVTYPFVLHTAGG